MLPAILTADLRFTPVKSTEQARQHATRVALVQVINYFRSRGFKSHFLVDGKPPVKAAEIKNPYKWHTGRVLPCGETLLLRSEINENIKYLAHEHSNKSIRERYGKDANGVDLVKGSIWIRFEYSENKTINKNVTVTVNRVKKSITYLKRLYEGSRTTTVL